MSESGEILKQGKFANSIEALNNFTGKYGGDDCSAVLESTRNWCVMYDLPEQVAEEVVLAHPLKVTATPLANSSFSESSNLQGKSHQA
ncbi:MAG: hypothetical protein V3S46_01545, partial [Nitrospinota bacterium]